MVVNMFCEKKFSLQNDDDSCVVVVKNTKKKERDRYRNDVGYGTDGYSQVTFRYFLSRVKCLSGWLACFCKIEMTKENPP